MKERLSMPHFVTKPTQASLKYYIFSTVVMAPVSKKMYRKEMEEWLLTNEGYEGFCDPRPINEQFPELYKEEDKYEKEALSKIYWNGSFWFVTEEDNYFV